MKPPIFVDTAALIALPGPICQRRNLLLTKPNGKHVANKHSIAANSGSPYQLMEVLKSRCYSNIHIQLYY